MAEWGDGESNQRCQKDIVSCHWGTSADKRGVTVFSEVSNLMNGRPIGQHPTSPEEGTYLCPNDLLLGRSSVENPGGPWNDGGGHSKRLRFIQLLIDDFWRRWTRYYFPTLIVRKKWHTGKRNLQIGDYVLVQDNGARRGQWRTGRVSKVYPDDDGLVRKVELKTCSESGKMSYIRRAIQRLVLFIPVEEQ